MSKIHLYNSKDKSEVRKKLYDEQGGIDKLTGLPLEYKDSVLDHSHETHYVRYVIHRQSNAFLGKLENNFNRMIKWWYNGTLPDLLRKCADYLELLHDSRYLHDGWLKSCQTKFNALNEKQKSQVLKNMAIEDGANGKQRKELFRKGLLSRRFTLTQIEDILQSVKE